MINTRHLLRPKEAAAYLGISYSTLAKWRLYGGTGPAYVKLGDRLVCYEKSVLDEWLAQRTRTSTSDVGAAV